jgi:hypothetical protein
MFLLTSLVTSLLIGRSQAQSYIGYPPPGATVYAGQNMTVQIVRPVSTVSILKSIFHQ